MTREIPWDMLYKKDTDLLYSALVAGLDAVVLRKVGPERWQVLAVGYGENLVLEEVSERLAVLDEDEKWVFES